MSAQGMVNVGSLLNEQHGNKVYAIGLGSNEGTVVAGHKWGGMMSVIHLPEAVPGSWEHLMHGLGAGDRIVFMNEEMKRTFCKIAYGHRAIGVVYDPKHERHGNYVPSVMPMRYNAFIYIGHSQALHPPHIQPVGHQMPETYPFGL
jgi:erythromycin esterase